MMILGKYRSGLSMKLDYIKGNNKLRQGRIILDNSEIKVEPGKVSYYKGDINIDNNTGFVGRGKDCFQTSWWKNQLISQLLKAQGSVFRTSLWKPYTIGIRRWRNNHW